MKKNVLLICLGLSFASVMGQGYEYKKGKVMQGDNVVATCDGKCGIFKMCNLTVSSPANIPLFTLSEQTHFFNNPMYADPRWLDVVFTGTPSQSVRIKFGPARVFEKQLMGMFFQDSLPRLVKDGVLDGNAVAEFVAKKKYDFSADSLAVAQFEKENKLRIDKAERASRKPFKFVYKEKIERVDGTTFSYQIVQDSAVIGRLEKRVSSTGSYGYVFYTHTEPFVFNGESTVYSPVAYMPKAESPNFDSDFIVMTNKTAAKLRPAVPSDAERQLLQYLIDKGLF